jgi:YVTN family beta-propeller protein
MIRTSAPVRRKMHPLHAIGTLAMLALLVSGLVGRPDTPVARAAGLTDSLAPSRGGAVVSAGGRVLHSTTTYAIYWKQVDKSGLGQTFYYEAPRCYGPGCLSSYGTDKNYEDRTGTFLQDVGGSAWYGILSQYWDRDQNGQPVPIFNESRLAGTWEDNSNYPNLGRGVPAASLQPADIETEIAKAIQHNGWNVTPDSLFFLYIPEEVQACTPTGSCTNAAGNGNFCGFHQAMTYNDQQVAYAVIPSPGDTTSCDATVTSPSTDLVVDNAINAEAHELVEAVTDPIDGRGWSDPVANLTDDGGEVGDKCEHDFPGRGSALADGGNITLNGHDYILQSLWSDLDGSCTLGRVAVPYLGTQGIQNLQVEDGSPSILITGRNFGPTATVLWNGAPIPTTFHSSQELGVSIPAGDLSKPGVASIAVAQQSTATGGTSDSQFIYIVPSGATITNSTASANFAGSTSIGTAPNELTITATGGTGTVALGQVNGNPAGGQTTGTTNSYFDVYASPAGFTGLTLQDCALNGGSQVDWFDPVAGWKAASKQTYNPSSHCATVTVDTTTSPSLAQLQGTALGAWSRTQGYVVLRSDNAIVPVADAGQIGSPIHVGNHPAAIVSSPDGSSAYVANADDNTVVQVDVGTNTLAHTFGVGKDPLALAIAPDGQTVYSANALDNTISVINLGQGSVSTIPVGTKPEALAVSSDGALLYVANRGSSTLSTITTGTNQVSPTTISAGSEPNFIALTPGGKQAVVANAAANQVLPISLPSGMPGAPIAVGKSPLGIAITPDGKKAYVANSYDNSVTPLDLTGATPSAGTPISVGANPSSISITPDGRMALVANAADGTVTPIDIGSNAAWPAFSVGSGAESTPAALAIFAVQPALSAPAKPVKQPNSAPNSNAGTSSATGPTATLNDSDPSISYKGGGWAAYVGRPASFGDLNNDVHATTNNGDSVAYTFKGTGIAYVSEKSDGYGTVQVSLDGSVQTIVDANAPGVHNQGSQTLYTISGLPSGQHTIKLVKKSGAYMLLDAFIVQP